MVQRPIPILMYHQVDRAPPVGSPMRGLVVSPRGFWWHMAVLWVLGYKGLSMTALEPYLRGERKGRVFGITFDDGYRNNLEYALPVLRRFGFTSTVYVVVNQIGGTNAWDAPLGVTQVPLMTVSDMQQWVDAGQEIASHGMGHVRLDRLPVAEQRNDVALSKTELERILVQPQGIRHFCYPYGAFNADSEAVAQAAGYTTTTTTLRGRVHPQPTLSFHRLPRVLVSRTTTWLHLVLKVATAYEDRRGPQPQAASGTR